MLGFIFSIVGSFVNKWINDVNYYWLRLKLKFRWKLKFKEKI